MAIVAFATFINERRNENSWPCKRFRPSGGFAKGDGIPGFGLGGGGPSELSNLKTQGTSLSLSHPKQERRARVPHES